MLAAGIRETARNADTKPIFTMIAPEVITNLASTSCAGASGAAHMITAPVATILAALIGAAVATGGLLLTWFISRRQRIADFRMAALDMRLKTHQEAYKLWQEMVMAMDDPKKGPETAARCQQWWYDHCLYLDARSRKEFIECVRDTVVFRMTGESQNAAEKIALLKRLKNVLRLLEEGVHLPPVGEAAIRPKDA